MRRRSERLGNRANGPASAAPLDLDQRLPCAGVSVAAAAGGLRLDLGKRPRSPLGVLEAARRVADVTGYLRHRFERALVGDLAKLRDDPFEVTRL